MTKPQGDIKKHIMAIALTTQPVTASATLQAADVAAIFAAIQPLLTLPSSEGTLANATGLSIAIQPNGNGVLNIRFSK